MTYHNLKVFLFFSCVVSVLSSIHSDFRAFYYECPVVHVHQGRNQGSGTFLHSEGTKPAEIIRRMQQQYGESCLSERKIYEWLNRFKNGRVSICDEERSGRPVSYTHLDVYKRQKKKMYISTTQMGNILTLLFPVFLVIGNFCGSNGKPNANRSSACFFCNSNAIISLSLIHI